MYRRCSHSVVVYVSTFLAFKPITGYIHFSTNSSYSHFFHNGLHSLSAMFPCQFGCVCVCVCGRSPGEGHGNPLQCSCLENPMDQGAWQATVHRVAKSQTRLKPLSTHISTSDAWLLKQNLKCLLKNPTSK